MEDFNIVLNLMRKNNVTQKQLADCLGVSEQKVSDWRAGRIKSWLKHIDKIAECLGVTVGDCLGIPADKKEKPADELDWLKKKLYDVMDGMNRTDLEKLFDHAVLLEAAKRNK